MFDAERPCPGCPFRVGQGSRQRLARERLIEIATAQAVPCRNSPLDLGPVAPRQCVGLMALLHRINRPNLIMRMAEVVGAIAPERLDPDGEAYAKWRECERAHVAGVEPAEIWAEEGEGAAC